MLLYQLTFPSLCATVHCAAVQTKAGLASAAWPGRCQIVQTAGATFYLDGAHTASSVRIALDWFVQQCNEQQQQQQQQRQCRDCRLVFNCSHERDVLPLLQMLATATINSSNSSTDNDSSGAQPLFTAVYCVSTDGRPSRFALPTAAQLLEHSGIPLINTDSSNNSSTSSNNSNSSSSDNNSAQQWQRTLAAVWQSIQTHTGVTATAAAVEVCTAVEAAEKLATVAAAGSLVLATGSLYVVSAVLEGIRWEP
jgi:folylpolyglutamate synthase/dihydropteroate synthase